MRQFSFTRRMLTAAIAIVQMVVPAVASVADAQLLSGSSAAALVHVEDHTGRSCRPAHPDDCALCQLLSHFASQRAQAPTLPSSNVGRSGAYVRSAPLLSFVLLARERSRAPPVG